MLSPTSQHTEPPVVDVKSQWWPQWPSDLSSSCGIAQHTVCWTLARSSQDATRKGWPLMPSLKPTERQSTNWMPHLFWMNIHICNPFANKGLSSRSYGFPSGHIWMWELDYKNGWTPKNWRFQTVVLEKTLESFLGCKEVKPVGAKGNQPWIFIGRTDAEAEAPIFWLPDVKSRLIVKTLMLGKTEGRRRRGWQRMRWWLSGYQWLNGRQFEQTLGESEG